MALNKTSIMRQEYKSLATLNYASHSELLFWVTGNTATITKWFKVWLALHLILIAPPQSRWRGLRSQQLPSAAAGIHHISLPAAASGSSPCTLESSHTSRGAVLSCIPVSLSAFAAFGALKSHVWLAWSSTRSSIVALCRAIWKCQLC
jgi:hypothetical protein